MKGETTKKAEDQHGDREETEKSSAQKEKAVEASRKAQSGWKHKVIIRSHLERREVLLLMVTSDDGVGISNY